VADVERAIMILGFPDLVGFGAWMDAASDSEAAVVIETLAALLLP
jgi:hypothetical protein